MWLQMCLVSTGRAACWENWPATRASTATLTSTDRNLLSGTSTAPTTARWCSTAPPPCRTGASRSWARSGAACPAWQHSFTSAATRPPSNDARYSAGSITVPLLLIFLSLLGRPRLHPGPGAATDQEGTNKDAAREPAAGDNGSRLPHQGAGFSKVDWLFNQIETETETVSANIIFNYVWLIVMCIFPQVITY